MSPTGFLMECLKIFVVQGTMSMRTVSVTCAATGRRTGHDHDRITAPGNTGLLESRDRHFAEFVDVLGRET